MHRIFKAGSALGLATLSALAQAVGATSVVTPVSGTTWQVGLTSDTTGAARATPDLSVWFDQTLSSNPRDAAVPAGWNPLLLLPDKGLPAAGVFDMLAPGAGLTPGQTAGSFSLDITDLRSATPVAWPYPPYALDGSGNVQPLHSGVTTPVPEPAASWLMALGVAGFAFGAHRIAVRRLA